MFLLFFLKCFKIGRFPIKIESKHLQGGSIFELDSHHVLHITYSTNCSL